MKLLIVDDHEIIREGLTAFLQHRDPGLLVRQADSGEAACQDVMDDRELDAVILDLMMPGMDGLAVIAQMARLRQDLPVVVLSSSEDPRDVRQALLAGARGYIPKSASRQTLWSALQLVLSGDVYVPPLILAPDDALPGRAAAAGAADPALSRLTHRQAMVLRLLAKGASNKEIARDLNLSEKTVKVHVTGIFKTLNVVNRRQAAEAARRLETSRSSG